MTDTVEVSAEALRTVLLWFARAFDEQSLPPDMPNTVYDAMALVSMTLGETTDGRMTA